MDPERNHKDENNFLVSKALDLWVNHEFMRKNSWNVLHDPSLKETVGKDRVSTSYLHQRSCNPKEGLAGEEDNFLTRHPIKEEEIKEWRVKT